MKQYISSPLAALALLFLLFSFHSASAARPLSATPLVHRDNDVKAAADGLIHQKSAVHSNEELSEMTGVEEEACKMGNEECLQRRLLSDAHLDYIYTQHHHKP